jgi:hypothetical protein
LPTGRMLDRVGPRVVEEVGAPVCPSLAARAHSGTEAGSVDADAVACTGPASVVAVTRK